MRMWESIFHLFYKGIADLREIDDFYFKCYEALGSFFC